MGLDPKANATAAANTPGAQKESQSQVYDLNHIEGPFPFKVEAFDPGAFGLLDTES